MKTLRDKIKLSLVELYMRGFTEGKIGIVSGNQCVLDAYDSILSAIREEVPKEKTVGIKGILGTTHRDGVVNEGYNQALNDMKEKLK